MLSILIYGRNDAYGSLAQRRAALSINALAELLSHDDEIVFVDYNTDDDKLTFVESIADTLTDRARTCLRVVRVRPVHHRLLARNDAPPVIESIARNIGLRHTNPNNRWVLSTNPDIVVVEEKSNIKELLRGLDNGYYGAPRFEVPRFLWQRIDRNQPNAAIDAIVNYAPRLHLDETVKHYLPSIGFDAPGDFQLLLRSDLMEIGGFDETMQQAWHVDANLMARLALRYGKAGSVGDSLKVYHCEHTADTAAKHAGNRDSDSFDAYVHDVTSIYVNKGRAWGGEGLEFESLWLGATCDFKAAEAVASTVGVPNSTAYSAIYGPETYGDVPRIPRHTLGYVVDRLFTFSRDTKFAWLGADDELRLLVQTALEKLGFLHPLVQEKHDEANVLLIDNPGVLAPAAETTLVWREFGRFLEEELDRISEGLPRRSVLAINAIHSDFEALLRQAFDVILAPFTTRVRPALLKAPAQEPVSWLADLRIGEAGARDGEETAIQIKRGQGGYVFFGPYIALLPGTYRVVVTASGNEATAGILVLEILHGETFLAQDDVATGGRDSVTWSLDFKVPPNAFMPGVNGIELRLWSDGNNEGLVLAVTVGRV